MSTDPLPDPVLNRSHRAVSILVPRWPHERLSSVANSPELLKRRIKQRLNRPDAHNHFAFKRLPPPAELFVIHAGEWLADDVIHQMRRFIAYWYQLFGC